MLSMFRSKSEMVSSDAALPGRDMPVPTADNHFVLNTPLKEVPAGMEVAIFGMGCFWGVERMFWKLDGVFSTSVGYAGGFTPNATYEEICTGKTGHNEVVQVVFDPAKISYDQLLQVFWEGHDPTQGMRQGNDAGTQYRSGIYTTTDAQAETAAASKDMFAPRLSGAGYGMITTEILPAPVYYFAEGYHQQYLAKNPTGYCGIGGTGVTCPIGTNV
jgi:peptide-methionine (S)-S-oxide reductase